MVKGGLVSLSLGIIGLPNAGKSTLFNALLKRQIAQVAEYPYTTIEPNVGVVEVPDERLSSIADRVSIPKIVPAAVRFIDIAGLVKGAHLGEGLGNQFLAHIREVDAIIHVVRAFDSSGSAAGPGLIPHVMGDINPQRDIEVVNFELEQAEIKKPAIYVLNVSESDLKDSSMVQTIELVSKGFGGRTLAICAKLESELADLSEEEQKAYLKELGVNRSGLDQVIQKSYKLLDLITFFTIAGGRQVQAWPIKNGLTMIAAAELVHSDFARGFIKAEVVDWQKLVEAGNWHEAKEKGLVKTCGRYEEVKDGEVIEFKFKV